MVGATVACRPATPPLRAVRARSVGRVWRRGSERVVTPVSPWAFPGVAGGWLSWHSPLRAGHPARVRLFAAAGR